MRSCPPGKVSGGQECRMPAWASGCSCRRLAGKLADVEVELVERVLDAGLTEVGLCGLAEVDAGAPVVGTRAPRAQAQHDRAVAQRVDETEASRLGAHARFGGHPEQSLARLRDIGAIGDADLGL